MACYNVSCDLRSRLAQLKAVAVAESGASLSWTLARSLPLSTFTRPGLHYMQLRDPMASSSRRLTARAELLIARPVAAASANAASLPHPKLLPENALGL